ncbi:hypothetical protein [Lysinibacillus piscis]|uniref:YolD-like family protein n=1 Tax=Lysinibacillus piscis TaxID=2518931 RepID=A0ABQ5NM19_9BACI|nr:hypothetical protein [Lysinibacillus sp. KH24]GLC89357.1 hypothetical protein LYSBPC_24840 [Lysinibacillus sp. KH24]
MPTVKHWSFMMDYESNEIVIETFVNGEWIRLRVCEKDINSMQFKFNIAKQNEVKE